MRFRLTCFLLMLSSAGAAAPLTDLSGGQIGRIEFNSSKPGSRFAVIRGNDGPAVVVWGDLMMPNSTNEKVPAVVFSHGSEGLHNLYYEWAKRLNAAGYAVFLIDTFGPRGEVKLTSHMVDVPDNKQLKWDISVNLVDALYALKLLSTHPRIDRDRIYHMGWSKGGQVVLDAAWPTYQQHILPLDVKWAGSIAIYPGCNMRYRVDAHSKLPARMLLLLGEKDNVTLPQPCIDYAKELAAAGNAVTYRVYEGAYHVFDRSNQQWAQFKDGNYNLCSMDIRMPYGASDRSWHGATDKYSGKRFDTMKDWGDYLPKCQQVSWLTVESNAEARDQAIQDVFEFLR